VLHAVASRDGRAASIYPDPAEFLADIAAAYRDAVKAFAAVGCRYLQLDDTMWAHLCSTAQRQALRERGVDPAALASGYAATINAAIRDRPADMTVTMHLCRGNYRSAWRSEGGYEPVAEALFNTVDVDGYFLEYDSERAGVFEPLRFFPRRARKRVVLGLITTKSGALESRDFLKARVEDAARHAPIENLCLSPQCGFASTEEGNRLTEDEQWAKLRLCVETARDIWGDA
jgi:5-methyltetrahydropteroyltriglutamate--homocysteine methyltransferase